jgi:hypothetical protein
MKINNELIQDFKESNSKLLAVTKYWNLDEIKEFFSKIKNDDLDIFI